MRRSPGGEDGSAVVEFVAATVVLMLPLLYLLLTVFTLQRASFGVTEAAREAGRAVALAGTTELGLARAREAAVLALTDQGVYAAPRLWFTDGGCSSGDRTVAPVLTAGARYEVCVAARVALPFTANRVLGRFSAATVSVVSGYLLVVSPYRNLS